MPAGRASTTWSRSSTSTGSGRRARRCSGWDTDGYVERLTAFGWHAIAIDGHDVDAIEAAYAEAESTEGRPTAIVARTKKGKGVEAVEDLPGKHGKPLDDPEEAIQELGGERDVTVKLAEPAGGTPHRFETTPTDLPSWELGEEVATRKAYGEALTALGSRRGDVVALDGEVSNSTHSEDFREAHEDRYFEMFIAEQQLVAAAVGFQVRGWVPFASTFAAFFSRAYDFVRMAAISRADIRLSGSHAGVSIGEDGPSQMALEDLAAFRAVHGSTVLHPSDANQTAKLVAAMADTRASRSCAPCAGRRRCARRPTRMYESAGAGSSATATTSPSSRAGSPWTRPTAPPSRSKARASAPACSTATRSSRSTPRRSAPRRASAAP